MAKARTAALTLAESGALALAEAAADLDAADDATKFVSALESNRRLWQTLRAIAQHHDWRVPDARAADYAIATTTARANDERVAALIELNRRISALLAGGGDLDRIRERAYYLWEERGRPQGKDLEHWLIAEMEVRGRR